MIKVSCSLLCKVVWFDVDENLKCEMFSGTLFFYFDIMVKNIDDVEYGKIFRKWLVLSIYYFVLI